ncbi:MAG: thiamine biosynthesis protein ThiS [Streptosporangiaceae bacterium]|jgi:sulfur carrier protein|nr:thiamine biosynthesis protein ThiS [Streptosporangiaceae bacterium]
MKVIVNGDARDVPDEATVASVVEDVTAASAGIAVALNGEVVRRSEWAATAVREADRLEVLTAVQGG